MQRWQWLIAPSLLLEDEYQQQQARLLASLSLVLLLGGIPIVLVWIWANPDFEVASLLGSALIVAIGLLYGISRTRHYQLGAFFFLLCLIAFLGMVILFAPGTLIERMTTLSFLVVAVLLGSMLLQSWQTYFITLLSLVSTAVFVFIPDVPFAISYAYVVFMIIMPALLLLSGRMRDRYVRRLRISERRYRALFNQSHSGVAILDLDGRFLEVNENTGRILGHAAADLVGKRFDDVIVSGEKEEGYIVLQRLLGDETVPVYERVLRRRDGREVTVEINAELVCDAVGEPLHIQSVVRDVTERKQAAEMVTGVLDAAPNAIIVVDRQGTVLFANAYVNIFFGYKPEELVGRSHQLLIPERYHGVHSGFIGQYFSQPEVRPMGLGRDLYGLHRDGREFPAEVALSPLRIDGDLLVVASIVDITERKQAAQKLARQEEQLRILINQTPIGIVTIDMEGNVSAANPRSLEILGSPGTDATLGLNVLTLPTMIKAGISRQLTTALDSGKIVELETSYHSIWGKTTYVMMRAVPYFDGRGTQIGMIILVEDLTERRRAEEGMRQAQKLESVGVLAGGIAHDFNNLLVAMLGQTSLARAKMKSGSPGKQHVEKAETAARQAARLTHQLLAYSGRGQFRVEPLDLNQLLEENLHLFQALLPKPIQLATSFNEGVPSVLADVAQMQQVVMNLIINAAEAIGEQAGKIHLGTYCVEVADEEEAWQQFSSLPLEPGVYVVLEVRDNGQGMSAETIPRIFDPFFSTKEKGHGLGLAAVMGIVKGHHGGLRVDSMPARGTTFNLLLPVTEEQDIPEEAVVPEKRSGADRLVLVIDDEVYVQEAVGDILELEGIEVIAAGDGESGLALYRERQTEVALVLLDLSMPGWGGDQTLRALRALDPDVRIILSSGYTEVEVVDRFAGQELTGFLQKPYSAIQLIETVRSHLEAG